MFKSELTLCVFSTPLTVNSQGVYQMSLFLPHSTALALELALIILQLEAITF